MKQLITIGIIVWATSSVVAQTQKEEITPVNNNVDAAQVKSHNNTNNNREANNTPNIGTGTSGKAGTGTKKKFELGKFLRKK